MSVPYITTRMATDYEIDREKNYNQMYPDEDFLAAVEKHAPASTSEIVDEIGCNRGTATHRLGILVKRGPIESKKIGRSTAWFFNCE